MSKGKQAAIGAENVSANGYAYVKTSTGWRLKHHIIAEKKFGHAIDTKVHRVYFGDGNKENLDPDNIKVAPKNVRTNSTYYRRLQRIEDLMSTFVEDASDVGEALRDLKDCLGNVRSSHGFSASVS